MSSIGVDLHKKIIKVCVMAGKSLKAAALRAEMDEKIARKHRELDEASRATSLRLATEECFVLKGGLSEIIGALPVPPPRHKRERNDDPRQKRKGHRYDRPLQNTSYLDYRDRKWVNDHDRSHRAIAILPVVFSERCSITWWEILMFSRCFRPVSPTLAVLALILSTTDRSFVQQNAPKTEQHDDELPEGALARIGTLRFRLGGKAYSLTCSPTGRYLAVGGSCFGPPMGSPLVIFDSTTGQALHRLNAHAHVVRTVAFSADESLFASGGGDGKTAVWDMATGQRISIKDGRDDSIGDTTITFVGPGKTLAADENGRDIRLFKVPSGEAGTLLKGHRARIFRIASSVDGKQLASCAMDGTVRVWDLSSGKESTRFSIAENYGLTVSFSRDGKLLACGTFTGAIYLWDLTSGKERWHTTPRNDVSASIAFSPDGSELYTIRQELSVLDTADGREKRHFPMPAEMHHLAMTPDGKRVAAITDDHEVRLFDLKTGAAVAPFAGHALPVRRVEFSPDCKSLVTASAESEFRLWDASTGKPLKDFQGKAGSVAFSPDGRTLATTAEDDSVSLWDVRTAKRIQKLAVETNPTNSWIDFLAGEPPLLVCDVNAQLTVWDASTGKLLPQHFTKGPDPLSSSFRRDLPFAVARDGRTIAVDSKKRTGPIVIWDARTGKELRSTDSDASILAISADGRLLAANGHKCFLLIDAMTGKDKRKIEQIAWTAAAAFSPDGRMLATADASAIRLWETASMHQRRSFVGHQARVGCLAFSPDGTKLASGSDDTTALIWDLSGGQSAKTGAGGTDPGK